MGYDARIDQLEGCSPESCLSWLRSHEGYLKHDLITLVCMCKIMNNLCINFGNYPVNFEPVTKP